MNKAALIAGLALVAAAGTAMAQETTQAPEFAMASTAARAEVQADFAVWSRAGLASLHQGDGTAVEQPGYERRLARYTRMRQGAEYAAELQRLQGTVRSQTAAAAAPLAR